MRTQIMALSPISRQLSMRNRALITPQSIYFLTRFVKQL